MDYFRGSGQGVQLDDLMREMARYRGVGRNDAASVAGANAVNQATRDTGRRVSIDQRRADLEQQTADEADAKRWHEQHLRDQLDPALKTIDEGMPDIADEVGRKAWYDRMQLRKGQRIRAGQEGEAAVKDALRPADIRALIQQMMQPPAYTPEESAAIARAMGPNAVEGAIRPPPQGPAGWYPPAAPTGYAPDATRAAHYGPQAVGNAILPPEQGGAAPEPLPMTPPGQVFGPRPVAEPEGTVPSQDDLNFIQRRRDWINRQGTGAVERELEE